MNSKQHYVPPKVKVFCVEMETSIATPVSFQIASDIEDWVVETDPVGNISEEGGDVYIPWR